MKSMAIYCCVTFWLVFACDKKVPEQGGLAAQRDSSRIALNAGLTEHGIRRKGTLNKKRMSQVKKGLTSYNDLKNVTANKLLAERTRNKPLPLQSENNPAYFESQEFTEELKKSSALERKIFTLLKQCRESDGKFRFPNEIIYDTLFGMGIIQEDSASADTLLGNKYFDHYNSQLFEKIYASLDLPLVRIMLKHIPDFELWDGNISMHLDEFLDEDNWSQSMLLQKVHLNTYPQELKKYRKRYAEIMTATDNASLTTVTDLDIPSQLNERIISFWVRRSYDGTADIIESILRKAIQIKNPLLSRTIDSIENAYGKYDNGEQMVFTHNSFCDEKYYTQGEELFPGHNNMLFSNAFLLDSLSNFKNDAFNFTVDGDKAEELLRRQSGCSMFNGDYNFYGIVEKGGVYIWTRIVPEYTVGFKPRIAVCGEFDDYSLCIQVNCKGVTEKPLLLSAVKTGSRSIPKGRVYRLKESIDSSTVEKNDATPYSLITTYMLPENQKQIQSLLKEDLHVWGGAEMQQMYCEKSYLLVQWSNGVVDTVNNDTRFKNNFNMDSKIVEILLTDINGDGLPDLYCTTNMQAKWVAIMNKDKTFTIIFVKRPYVEDWC